MRKLQAVNSVYWFELRRHYRSRRTVATVAIMTFLCVVYLFNILRVTNIARGRNVGTTGHFYLQSINHDILYPTVALSSLLMLVLACFATFLGAGTIVGAREDGTLRTVQSLPFDRRTVFIGSVFARVTIVAVVVVVVFGLTLAQAYRIGLSPSLTRGIGFVSIFVAHLAGYTAVGVSLSTLRRRRSVVFGAALVAVIGLLLASIPLSMVSPRLTLLGPGPIFDTLVAGLDDRVYTAFQVEHGGERTGLTFSVDELPLFASTSAALLSQTAWIVLPLAIGLYRYERSDITN
ncbi:ABC transporter permease subunit [Halovivax gelatinilyticus]|uniref:ABC transporter permease subunit n=1 Tax=Halovivax gelatinilyticus TaxID=2961597 RepID=UPI0020CA61DA|nr:ABC transporter permease [Halovivax gelatinilyticus]